MPTAILIDGAFFLRRYPKLYGPIDYERPEEEAQRVANDLYQMALKHLNEKVRVRTKEGLKESWKRVHQLYRVFYYDCPPLEKRVHKPISKSSLVLRDTPQAKFRRKFHQELRAKRKVALRLGYLDEDNASWQLRPEALRELLKGTKTWASLQDEDFTYYARQKGVDMRIGLDIASMAYKKQVDRIVLVAGDSDFVPAAKLARREGIDFILDPMWNPIKEDLHEHIDGLQSRSPRPRGQ